MVDHQEKCTKQSAQNANKNVKFRSNLTKADPYIAKNVGQKKDHPEEIDFRLTS